MRTSTVIHTKENRDSTYTRSLTQPIKRRVKLSPEMEDDSSDVDDPSEMEDSGNVSKEENNIETENITVNNRVPEGDSHEQSDEESPPLKKIKLSSGKKDKQKKTVIIKEEKQTEEHTEFECNYENMTANFYAEELTSHDEILTFQCPKNFDVKTLLNKTIDLSKCTKMKDNYNKYVCQTVKPGRMTKMNCVFPSKEKGGVFMKLPVAGHVVLREVLKIPKTSAHSFDNDMEPPQLPTFDSLKRHPLLGSEWNDHLRNARKQLRKHKKLLRKSLKHEKSLEKSEKERKKQKKKLKNELALLKKKQILESDN